MNEEKKALESLQVISPAEPLKSDVATLTIHCNLRTGDTQVGGHIDNLHLNLQMLMEAGHILIERSALIRKGMEKKAESETTH